MGYYPTKDMTDPSGNPFKPGSFARLYLTYDVFGERCYVYSDFQFIATNTWLPKILDEDAGVAVRPFERLQGLEFRPGSEIRWDPQAHELDSSLNLGVRFVF